MNTVGTARLWAMDALRRAQTDSPELSADLLLGFVLGWTRERVLTHPERGLSDTDRARLRELVRRLARGEPLQYLTGEKEFFGRAFKVTPEVLIPRPETELLVEEALQLAGGSCSSGIRFADVGAGSGCIAVSLAGEIPASTGWAIDLSAAALRVARENAVRHGVARRIHFVQGDLLECFARSPAFDLILSNPPYVALAEYDSLLSVVRDHEPPGALFGGEAGLDVYRRMIPGVASRLVPGGYLLLELGAGQADPVGRLVEAEGLALQTIIDDLRGIPRCLVARKIPGRDHG